MKYIYLIIPILISLSPLFFFILIIFGFLWELLLCVTIVICANLYFETFSYKGMLVNSNREKREPTIRVISYNVNLAYTELNTNENAVRIADFLVEQDADVILLQEYNPHFFPELQKIISINYPYEAPYTLGNRYKVVFSKYPIDSFEQLKDNYCSTNNNKYNRSEEDLDYLPICVASIIVGQKKISFVNCHLQSNNYSPLVREFKNSNISFTNLLVGIFANIKTGGEQRNHQIKALMSYLEQSTNPVLICGDFNDVNGSSCISLIKNSLYKDAWWENGWGFGYTVRSLFMKWRIDHIFYNQFVIIREIKIGKFHCSDHYPVICNFITE